MPHRALMLADSVRLPYRVLRCAAACFDEVIVLGTRAAMPLRFSRFCGQMLPLEGGFHSGSAADPQVERINAVDGRLSVDCVLPSCAVTTRFLAANKGRITAPVFPVPPASIFDTLDNKWFFGRLCAELGVPVPEQWCFNTGKDLAQAAADGRLDFPLVMKPLGMWGSYGVRKLDSAAELPPRPGYEPILVQRYAPGEDYCAFYLCRSGQVLASVGYFRRADAVVFEGDPAVDRHARAIIEHLGYDGVIGFDVRRGPAGELTFIECNPRFWYRMNLAMLAGLNPIALGASAQGGTNGAATAPLPAPGGISMASMGTLCRRLFAAPWRLNRHELRLLAYFLADPAMSLVMARERVFVGYGLADGQQIQ